MYPFIGDGPLSAKLLDPGRDDYYGHAGGWTDSQDSPWLVRLDAQTPLAVTISGPGSVAADVPRMQCAATCTTTWNAGQRLTLSAAPGSGAKLVRWEGACSGSGSCAVDVTPGAAVTAKLEGLPGGGGKGRRGVEADRAPRVQRIELGDVPVRGLDLRIVLDPLLKLPAPADLQRRATRFCVVPPTH